MKVCFVGIGSIGKRHVKNLSSICRQDGKKLEIHVLRSSTNPIPQELDGLIQNEIFSYENLDKNYDAIFITNPTNMHYATIEALKNHSTNFFVEKPLFESIDKNIESMKLPVENRYYIACPLRFTNVLSEASKIVKNECIFSVRAISSSYLPDWRPNVDYTKVYSASKEQGGGVCIDLIHEWDYLTSLFGFPDKIKMLSGKYSNLKITSEDLAVYIAEYPDKLVEVHLDYFGRKSVRYAEFFTNEGTYKFDIFNSRVFINDTIINEYKEDPNEKYIKEMNYFLDLMNGKAENINNIQNSMKVLKLTQGFNV